MTAALKMTAILVVSFPVASIASPTSPTVKVVYDSLSGFLSTAALGFANSIEVGQAITLEGNARQVNQIELFIGSNRAMEYRVRFYELNGMGGAPGTLIWESQSQTYPYTPGSFRKVVSVDVPNVKLPSSFAWVVAHDSRNMLVGISDPPSIGTNLDIWRRGNDAWQTRDFSTGVFGARIRAIPEPNSLWVFAIAAAVIFATNRSIRLLN
jgi:hypothetical protein